MDGMAHLPPFDIGKTRPKKVLWPIVLGVLCLCVGPIALVALSSAISRSPGFAEAMERAESAAEKKVSQAPPEPPPAPLIELSASDLMAAYQENEIAADLQLEDKRLIVVGIIGGIGTDILGAPYVALQTSDGFSSVQCMFDRKQMELLAGLRKGQSIKIEAKCSGLALTNVIMRDSKILP